MKNDNWGTVTPAVERSGAVGSRKSKYPPPWTGDIRLEITPPPISRQLSNGFVQWKRCRAGRRFNLLDSTQPCPQVKWPNPTRPRINMKLWIRPIYARLTVCHHMLNRSACRSAGPSSDFLTQMPTSSVHAPLPFCPDNTSLMLE